MYEKYVLTLIVIFSYLALVVLIVERFSASRLPIGQTSVCQNITVIIELRQLAHLKCKD